MSDESLFPTIEELEQLAVREKAQRHEESRKRIEVYKQKLPALIRKYALEISGIGASFSTHAFMIVMGIDDLESSIYSNHVFRTMLQQEIKTVSDWLANLNIPYVITCDEFKNVKIVKNVIKSSKTSWF